MATKRIGNLFSMSFQRGGEISIPPPTEIPVTFVVPVTIDEIPEHGTRVVTVTIAWTSSMTRAQLLTAARDAVEDILTAEGGGHTVV